MSNRNLRIGIVVVLVSITLPLLAVEWAFRLEPNLLERLRYNGGAATDPREMTAPHSKYGISGNIAFAGHDSRGWRNKTAVEKADIVALGDSQTYGLGADADHAWPQQLRKKLDRIVYQFAIGGAGPFNYALMMDDVLALKPSVVVATIYFGNDLFDSYRWAHGAVPFSYKIKSMPPEVRSIVTSTNQSVWKEIEQAELVDPRLIRLNFLDCQAPRPVPDKALQTVGNVPSLPMLLPRAYAENRFIRTIMERSAAFNAIYISLKKTIIPPSWTTQIAPIYPEPVCFDAKSPISTVFAPAYRMSALDPTDARVREGVRVTLASFRFMKNLATNNGTEFFVLLIPTKELAFKKALRDSGIRSEAMEEVWNAELAHKNNILNELTKAGIKAIDPLSAFENAIDKGLNPYPERNGDPKNDAEGHPRAEGYEILADQVAKAIRQ